MFTINKKIIVEYGDMQYILIVEDDIGLNKGLCASLKSDDRNVISCSSLTAAREQIMLFHRSYYFYL